MTLCEYKVLVLPASGVELQTPQLAQIWCGWLPGLSFQTLPWCLLQVPHPLRPPGPRGQQLPESEEQLQQQALIL